MLHLGLNVDSETWQQLLRNLDSVTLETILEQALHLEAVTGVDEEEQTPKVRVIKPDETKDLAEAVTMLVNQLSLEDKQNSRN